MRGFFSDLQNFSRLFKHFVMLVSSCRDGAPLAHKANNENNACFLSSRCRNARHREDHLLHLDPPEKMTSCLVFWEQILRPASRFSRRRAPRLRRCAPLVYILQLQQMKGAGASFLAGSDMSANLPSSPPGPNTKTKARVV